ncbi:MAG: phosphatase PAP2 family protein [Acidobacteria bacterium]|nr:phosphatase PAP2 family protein [Acidobacteriota bacterium]
MEFTLAKNSPAKPVAFPIFLPLRQSERGALLFFFYIALLGYYHHISKVQIAGQLLLPVLLYSLWSAESKASKAWSRVLRDFGGLGLILLAYWSLGVFHPKPNAQWQNTWIVWDRELLGPLGLRAIIESTSLIPLVLETVYLLLYTLPIFSLLLLYAIGDRPRIHRYLTILLAGTFTVYGLLPHLPVHSPRLIFPETDLPNFSSFPRLINTWVLDHMDISTSVCPSGHVGVAFSNAFALFTVFRKRPLVWRTGFILAAIVYVATIYGRYHYAVDGLLSIGIVFCVWQILEYGSSREA